MQGDVVVLADVLRRHELVLTHEHGCQCRAPAAVVQSQLMTAIGSPWEVGWPDESGSVRQIAWTARDAPVPLTARIAADPGSQRPPTRRRSAGAMKRDRYSPLALMGSGGPDERVAH